MLAAAAIVVRRDPMKAVRPVVGLAVLAGVGSAIANVCYLAATRRGLLSLVAVITSLYPATTVGLATVLDGERLSRSQVLGMGLALVAVGLVSAARRASRRRRWRRSVSTSISISASLIVNGQPIITASWTGPEPAG